MNKCTTKSLYDSIQSCPGQKNLPGIRRRLYYIPKSFIAAFPQLPKLGDLAVTSMAALAKLEGDFVLDQDKFFQFIDLKDEASNVTFEPAGDDSPLFNNQASAIVIGMPDEVKGFARQTIDDDLVYVYQDRAGKFCVIGNEMFKTKTSPSGDTGAEATASTTSTFAISCFDECPVPTYVGKLPISAEEYIDCSTGEVMAYADDTEEDDGE